MFIKKITTPDEILYELKHSTAVTYIKEIVKLRDYQGIIPKIEFSTWDSLHRRVVKDDTRFFPLWLNEEQRKRCSPYLIIYKQSDDLNKWEIKISDIRIDWYYNLGDEERWGDGIRSICLNEKWGAVEGKTGKLLVPFGKYDFIDGFNFGLSRIKKRGCYYINEDERHKNHKERWGIINTLDEIVLPLEYDAVYSFFDKQFKNVYIVKDGVRKEFPLWMSEKDYSRPYYNDYDNEMERELEYLREKISGYRKPDFVNRNNCKGKNYMEEFLGWDNDYEEEEEDE